MSITFAVRSVDEAVTVSSKMLRQAPGAKIVVLFADSDLGREAALIAPRPTSADPKKDAAASSNLSPEARPFLWAPGEADRLSLHPIRHQDLWDLYKQLEGLHWTAQDVNLAADRADWRSMSDDMKLFVKMQLAFFARVDIDVLDNIGNLAAEVDCLESQFFFAAQAAQECVHSEAYTLQIEAILEGSEREDTLNAVRTIPIIRRMREWALSWFDRSAHPIELRLVAQAAVEGVLFSSSFAALQWLRSLGRLPGITLFNDYISRDEWRHTHHLCVLVSRYLAAKAPCDAAHAIFTELVDILRDFVREALPVRLIGMNDELMVQYVRFQADCVLHELGYPPLFGDKNPLRFMENLLLNEVSKTNFFEHHNTQYRSLSHSGASALALDDSPIDP